MNFKQSFPLLFSSRAATQKSFVFDLFVQDDADDVE